MSTRFSTANSAVNTALLSSIFDLTNAQKVLAGAVFGFTSKFGMVDAEKSKTIDDETKSSIKLLNETASSISAKLAEIEKEQKSQNKRENKKSVLEYLSNISEVFGADEVKQKRFTQTVGVLDKFLKNANSSTEAVKVFEAMTAMTDSLEKLDIMKMGQGLAMVGVGISAIGLAIFTLTKTVSIGGLAMATTIMALTLGFAYALTKLDNEQLDKASIALARTGASMLLVTGSIMLMSQVSVADILKGAFMFVALSGAIVASNKMFNLMRTTSYRGFVLPLAPVAIAGSLGILAGSIYTWNALVPDMRKAVAPILFITAFAGALILINRLGGRGRRGGLEDVGKALVYMSASIAVLAMSIMVWDALSPQQVAKPVLAIVGLALGLALMNKIAGGDMRKSAIGLVIASASVAVLALSIYLWDYLGIDTDMIALPALAIAGLMGGLALISKMGGAQILMSAGALILTGIAIGIIAYSLKMWDNLSGDTMTNAGLFLTGVVAGLVILGNLGLQSLMGAGALILTAGAVWIIGKGLELMSKSTGDQMLNAGLFITGLGAVITLLGLAPWSILGAVALGAGGVALYAVGKGMQQMNTVDFSKTDAMIDAISKLASTFFDIGGPIDTPFILSGAMSVLAIGRATLAIAQTLKTLSDAKMTDAQIRASADSIGVFIESMLNVFDNYEGSFMKVKKGIWALSSLGNMISSLAKGLVEMSTLNFVEYEVQDGKLVPVSSVPFNRETGKRVGDAIAVIIDSLTAPLAKVGASAGMFSSGDVGRGVKALTGLGNLVKTIADGIAGMASLQFTEYEVRDGRLVPVSTRKFREDGSDFRNVGKNIDSIIQSLTDPLSKIGAGSSWAKSSDVEKGIDALENLAKNVINPMSKVTEFIKNQQLDPTSAKNFALSFSILVGGIAMAMQRVAENDFDDANDNMETFVDNVKDLVSQNDGLARTRNNFERIARSLVKINTELSNDKFKRIVELKETMEALSSNKMYDTMFAIVQLLEQRLVPIMQGVNENLTQTGNYIMNQSVGVDPNNPLMAGQSAMLNPYGSGGLNTMMPQSTQVTQADLESLMSRFEDILINHQMNNKNKN